MVGNICLKRELKAAGPSEAALRERGLRCCPPPAHGHHPTIVCCWLHAISKDKTKPVTPEFNFDLAVAGLKSHEDGQLDCKQLIPPAFSSPLFFTPFLSNWPGLLLRNWENKQKIDLGLVGAAVWKMTQATQRRCSPGEDAQSGLYLLPLTSVAPALCRRGSFLVFGASLERLVVGSPAGRRGAACECRDKMHRWHAGAGCESWG